MEQIDGDYAEKLHSQRLNPYSQCLINSDEGVIWSIKTLNEEAYLNILKPLESDKFTEFDITKKKMNVKIKEKKLILNKKKDLFEEFYYTPADKYLNIEFLTPTSFKSNGNYIIIPNVKYIYQSLMNKCSAASDKEFEMFDSDTLEQLTQNSQISQYKLKSTYFPMEGIRIPSFKGSISFKMNGTDTLARYARFLMKFGEYSGVGIKTSMGMGAIRLVPAHT
jgi:CRISPR-associated endoribonuclease Cas6